MLCSARFCKIGRRPEDREFNKIEVRENLLPGEEGCDLLCRGTNLYEDSESLTVDTIEL